MSNLSRRSFLSAVGKTAAAAGVMPAAMAFGAAPAHSRTPAAGAAAATAAGRKPRYQVFKPGHYLDWEKPIILPRFEEVAKGPASREVPKDNASAQQAGFMNLDKNTVNEFDIVDYNRRWTPGNPLFVDPAYARKAGFSSIPAFPCFKTPSGTAGGRLPKDMADVWLYANDGSDVELFQPIQAGDVFHNTTDKIFFSELTDPGSDFRQFIMGTVASMYNQRGELVARRTGMLRNGYKKIIDGSPRPDFTEVMNAWIPDFPEAHYTTDEEWERIADLWEKESVRGSQKLYWEDVNVGDQPPAVCSGPVSYMDIPAWHGPAAGQKLQMLRNREPEYRDRFGNYLFNTAMHYGGRNVPGARCVFYNNTAAGFIMRAITNYIGDHGFLTSINWRIKQLFAEMQDPRFQGGEYLDEVPHMKGKTCTVHGSEGDTIIARAYVTGKRVNEKGEHIVDFGCWAETLDNRIISTASASARLPSRSAG